MSGTATVLFAQYSDYYRGPAQGTLLESLTPLLIAWLIIGGLFGAAAGHISEKKGASGAGIVYGFFFGPFGLIAAGFLDNRLLCPQCGGRLNGTAKQPHPICQHCHVRLDWRTGNPRVQEAVNMPAEESNLVG